VVGPALQVALPEPSSSRTCTSTPVHTSTQRQGQAAISIEASAWAVEPTPVQRSKSHMLDVGVVNGLHQLQLSQQLPTQQLSRLLSQMALQYKHGSEYWHPHPHHMLLQQHHRRSEPTLYESTLLVVVAEGRVGRQVPPWSRYCVTEHTRHTETSAKCWGAARGATQLQVRDPFYGGFGSGRAHVFGLQQARNYRY